MKNHRAIFLLLLCLPLTGMAQPNVLWTQWFGGPQTDNGYAVRETPDSSIAIAGETRSFGVGGSDFWLIKTAANGDTLWTRTYGGPQDETCFALEVTPDSGLILAGRSNSFGGGWSGWAVRTTATGDTLWTHKYGGAQRDEFAAVAVTPDSGFVFVGYTLSYGAGSGDFWVVRTNGSGDTLWTRTYGGDGSDQCYAVQNAAGGGFMLAGSTESFGNGHTGSPDFWLVSISATGDSLWSRTYGGSGSDVCTSLAPLGNGWALGGYTQSFGAGNSDAWIVQTGTTGDSLTSRTLGTPRQDYCYALQQTGDGGLIIGGEVSSEAMAGGANYWLVKADVHLDTLWNCVFGGTSVEHGRAVTQTMSGDYVMTGSTYSYGAGIPNVWTVKCATPTRSIIAIPDSFHFGNVLVGAHRDSVITVRVTGTYETILDSVTAPHGFTTDYPGIPISLEPQQDFLVSVRFQPDSLGVFDDTIRIYSNSPGSPTTVLVRGNGAANGTDDPKPVLLPREFALGSFPNPFNPQTTLTLDVPFAARLHVDLYDVNGRLVRTLSHSLFTAGQHRLTVDGTQLASGVYFVRMEGTAVSLTRKLVLMK
ncbi:MAG TPA: T9SS type A sorting domain-containing protein [bacterium]|jgi:hypothetical protein